MNALRKVWRRTVPSSLRVLANKAGVITPARRFLQDREVRALTAPLVSLPFYQKQIALQKFKVVFISPWFDTYPLLISSLREQTYKNWELIFVYDGPFPDFSPEITNLLTDPRIHLCQTRERANDWGHTPRELGFQYLRQNISDSDFVVVTNSDNYHVPGFIESLLAGFNDATIGVYCDMLHNYYSWRYFQTRLEYSFIDCGCLMLRSKAALEVGWTDKSYEADWRFVEKLLSTFGENAFQKIPAPLFVHN